MANKFTQEDLYQSDIYGDLRNSLERTIETYDKADQEAREFHDNLNKNAQAAKMTAKGMRDLNKANLDSDKVLKQQTKILEQKKKLQIELNNLSKKDKQEIAALRLERQRQNKILKEEAILNSKTSTEYEKQSVILNQLRRRYKDLALSEGETSSAVKKLQRDIQQLDGRLKAVDATVGQHQRNVGNYKTALNGAVTSLKNFAAALGVVAGMQLLNRVVRDAVGVMRDFGQAQADLSSVLGVNLDEMEALTDQAKELGATTKFTASEVSNLQLELAKLGFTQAQIQEMTGATLELAAAAGTDLANAATIVGSTLRGFGLEAIETQRVVDVMAKSFSSSSLDIDKFASSMANVAPAAAAIGLTIEETTALIGTLTDAGIDASSAGTGLRNMFLESKKQGIDFQDALIQIANSTDKLGTSFDLFGKKGSTLGVILAENMEQTAGLTDTLNNAAGAAGEMADKQLNTLNGALDLLRSAWEGYILGADGSSGASERLKNVITFLANNLKTIMKILIGGIKVWILYKLQMKLFRVEVNAAGVAVNRGLIPGIVRAGKAALASVKGFKLASLSVRSFGNALKSIPFLSIIAGITTVISLFSDMGDETENLAEETSALDEAVNQINENYVQESAELRNVLEALKLTNAGTKERKEAIDKINETYGTTLENLDNEEEFVISVNRAYQDLLETLKEKVRFDVTQEKRLELTKQLIDAEDRLAKAQKDRFDIGIEQGQDAIELSGDEIAIMKEIRDLEGLLKDLDPGPIPDLLDDDGGGTGGTGTKGKSPEELAKERLAQIKKENDLFLLELEAELLRQGKSRKEIEDRLSKERLDATADELLVSRELLGTDHEETIKLLNKFQKQTRAIEDQEVKDNETRRKNDEADAKKRFEDLKKRHADELKEFESMLIKQGFRREEIEVELADKRLEQLRIERDEALEIFGEGHEKFIEAENKFQNALLKMREDQRKKLEDERKKRREQLKKDVQETIRILKEVTEFIIADIERQIEARKKNVEDSQNEQERLAELAREGNADAAEALVAERQREAREELAIEALERKKRNLLVTVAALERASQLINSGDGDPFNNARQGITEFLNSLPKLKDGTDQTLAHTLGYKPGVDSHLIWADNDEMILNPEKVKELQNAGLYTTDAVTRAALMAQNQPTLRHVVRENRENKPNAVVNAINKQNQILLDLPKKMPKSDMDWVNLVKIIREGNTVKRDHMKQNGGIEF